MIMILYLYVCHIFILEPHHLCTAALPFSYNERQTRRVFILQAHSQFPSQTASYKRDLSKNICCPPIMQTALVARALCAYDLFSLRTGVAIQPISEKSSEVGRILEHFAEGFFGSVLIQ